MTIIPEAVPVRQILAEWYTRGGGDCSTGKITFYHVAEPRMSIFQMSPTAYEPVLPPWTIKYGFK